MKKIFAFLLMAATVLSAASCSKKLDEIQGQLTKKGDKLYKFYAGFDDETSKAYVEMGNGKVSWENEDKVVVVNGVTSEEFVFNSAEACFESKNGIEWINNCGLALIFPSSIYKSQSYVSGEENITINFNLPDTQEFKEEGRCTNAPMAAIIRPDSWGGEVVFKNICGILKIQAMPDSFKGNVDKITFSAYHIAGAGALNFVSTGSGNYSINMAMASDATATNSVSIFKDFTYNKDFFFFLPPGVYTSSQAQVPTITVDFTNTWASDVSHTAATNVYIQRNHLSAAINYFQTLYSGGGNSIGGTGAGADATHPYLISTPEDLVELSKMATGTNPVSTKAGEDSTPSPTAWASSGIYYRLTNDIDMSKVSTDLSVQFSPIGPSAKYPFAAYFDGNGHAISNLTLAAGTENAGFFGVLTGTVTNLTLTNFTVGGVSATKIAGDETAATITGCTLNGNPYSKTPTPAE